MKRLLLLSFMLIGLLWVSCEKEEQDGVPPVKKGQIPKIQELPTLEASTAKEADFVEGKKLIVHGNITLQNNIPYFKFSDGTLIKIFSYNTQSFPQEIITKLNTEGQEVSVTGTFTNYKLKNGQTIKEIVYEGKEDLNFGKSPETEEILTLEASTSKVADYTAHLGKKVKLHGNIAEIQGNKSFFKLSDNTLIQIFTPKFKELPAEISDKLKTVGQEVTVTGVFTDYKKDESSPVVRQIIYQNATEDLLFGNITPPTPEEVPTLEVSTAKITDYTAHLGKKVKLHGNIAEIQGNKSFFKLSDNTLIQIFTPKFKELPSEISDKLKTVGQEVTVTGIFTDYKKDESSPVVRQIIYQNATEDLLFGNITPPIPEEIPTLEASTSKVADYTAHLGKKVKLHGIITIKNNLPYFKFKDGTEIQVIPQNYDALSNETKDKLATEGYELTATGTFRTQGTIKRLVYESENNLAFGNPPAPKPTLVLEANTATASHFEEGRKAKIHGLITVKGSSTYFKFKDGTEIQIYTDNFNNISQETKDKLKQEGYELTATGTFRTKGTIKRLVYKSENNLAFGNPPAPKPTLVLEANTATASHFEEGRKAKIHGLITVKGSSTYFKFKDGTEIQIYTDNFNNISQGTKDKLKQEGYELTATGTFRTKGTVKRLVYESKNDLAFGNPPAPKPTLVLEANTATASHFEEGRKAKIHGLITVKGSSTYFKFKDGTEIQIYTDNFNNISQGIKDKLATEDYELTATGTFRTKGTIKRLVYESENDLAFGNPPAPKPTLEIEASTATINQFEENREAKIHGNITVKNGNSYFKFQDGTLIQIFAYKSVKEAFSAEEKKKFTTEGQELTVTGTFVTYNGIKEIKVTKKENVIFGNTPTPTPPTQGNIFDFEDLPTGTASYTETGTLNGADGVTLKYVARTDVDKYGIQGKGLILFNKKPSNNTYIEITFPKGVKDFSFEYREAFGKGNRHFVIYEGEEGNSKKLDEKTFKNISTKETYSKTLNKSGSYTLTIKPAQGSKQFVIDNIKWTK